MRNFTQTRVGRYGGISLVVAIGAVACGAGSGGHTKAAAVVTPANTTTTTAAIAVHNANGGSYLTDGQGRTLYEFSADHNGKTSCHNGCVEEWPQFASSTMPTAASTAMGAVTLGAGNQVVYAGHPLYYFAGDHAAGDHNGNGLEDFGGLWSTVKPDGSSSSSSGGSSSPSGGSGGYNYG